jgi:serine protease Do
VVTGQRATILVSALVSAACLSLPEARARGFDRAIEQLSTRTVRFYGLKAGLSAGYGSGTLISDDGLVVTVASLLLDSERLRAVTPDGVHYGAEVIGVDEGLQLALVKLSPMPHYDRRGRLTPESPSGAGTFDFFEPGDVHSLIPGDWVIAAGNPFKVAEGTEPISVTVGVFSTRTKLDARRKTRPFPYHGDVLVIDAITSNPGAPGGPLVDIDGQWIGVIGRIVTSNRTHTNLNFAMPVDVVSRFVEATLNPQAASEVDESATRVEPYHGIKLFDLGYQRNLVYVERVKRGSPAKKAGVRKDDLIVSIDGRKVGDTKTFREIMGEKSPGDQAELSLIRNNKLVIVTMTLGEPK